MLLQYGLRSQPLRMRRAQRTRLLAELLRLLLPRMGAIKAHTPLEPFTNATKYAMLDPKPAPIHIRKRGWDDVAYCGVSLTRKSWFTATRPPLAICAPNACRACIARL